MKLEDEDKLICNSPYCKIDKIEPLLEDIRNKQEAFATGLKESTKLLLDLVSDQKLVQEKFENIKEKFQENKEIHEGFFERLRQVEVNKEEKKDTKASYAEIKTYLWDLVKLGSGILLALKLTGKV